MAQVQTYKNHRRFFWPHHFIVTPILVANFIFQLRHFMRDQSFETGWTALLAFTLVLLSLTARSMALTVQNRVIRLEERLRLAQLMPAEERASIEKLRTSQLIGLRFASDEEVVDLARRCASGELENGSAVKKSVKNWRPDHLRV